MRKVLCVCKGNTCRSPMMEAMLQHELYELGMIDVRVESAGIAKSAEGQSIYKDSAKELVMRGLNLDSHKSRYIGNIGNLARFDAILCVGPAEAVTVVEDYPELADRVEIVNASAGGIPNPWEQGSEAYRVCAITIEKAMAEIASRLHREWS